MIVVNLKPENGTSQASQEDLDFTDYFHGVGSGTGTCALCGLESSPKPRCGEHVLGHTWKGETG